MHGIVFQQLKKYSENKIGKGTWAQLILESGLDSPSHLATRTYPDEHLTRLLSAASEVVGQGVSAILEDFGRYLTIDLLVIYGALLKPEWRTLEVLENTEETIHKVVRLRNPGADPPKLTALRPNPDVVVIRYDSPRRLCALGVGLGMGVADHFGEKVEVHQPTCMHRGDPHCDITFKLLPRD